MSNAAAQITIEVLQAFADALTCLANFGPVES